MNLETFCHKFQALLDRKPQMTTLLDEGRLLVSTLVGHHDWFVTFLNRLHSDRTLFNEQKPSLWPNEITLYRSPDQSFMVLAYIWEPSAVDAIHDHGSWGIIGAFINNISETKYRRLDDGRSEGFAELQEASSHRVEPQQTTFVLPLDEGIHRMENHTDRPAITVNVYGRVMRKGYIHFFDPEKRTVSRVYPPRTHKEVLIVRTLGHIRTSWAEAILTEAMGNSLPDYIRREYELSLAMLSAERK